MRAQLFQTYRPLSCLVVLLAAGLVGIPAGAADIDENGVIRLNVNFGNPPSPNDINLVRDELERANEAFCDATDGQLRIGEVVFSTGHSAEAAADMVILGGTGRSYATGLGSGQVFLYRDGWSAGVITHEWGHSILGNHEEYEEQQRFGAGCGLGPGFDTDVRLDGQWNSIMQQHSGSVCRTPGGDTRGSFDLGYWGDVWCRTLADCAGVCTDASCPATGFGCERVPELESELSVSTNFDQRRGTNNGCPAPRAGSILVVGARLNPNTGADFPGPGVGGRLCGNGTLDTGEMCDGTALDGEDCLSQGFSGGTLGCHANCSLDTSGCTVPATCGNGFPQANEQCDPPGVSAPSSLTCTSLGFSSNEPILCGSHCGWDYSQCPGAITVDGFDITSLQTAIATSDASWTVVVLDELGDVGDISVPGPSRHILHLFFRRNSESGWSLYFAAPADEYDEDGSPDELVSIDVIDMGFDASGNLSSVNGDSSATSAEITLAGFAKSAADPVTLEVRLDGVSVETWNEPWGAPAVGSRFNWVETQVYAGEPGTADALQVGECTNEAFCDRMWNETTGRFEGSAQLDAFGMSGWERAVEAVTGFNLVPQEGFPTAATPPDCGADFNAPTAAIATPDQVMMVLDRSGSMSLPVNLISGNGRSRLEYVQDAARAFAIMENGLGVDVGFISFNQEVSSDIGLAPINAGCGGTTPHLCGDRCVNRATDPDNCGVCGTECAGGDVCSAFACAASCTSGTTECSGICVNTQTDHLNCGTCGTTCDPGLRCVSGACTDTGVPPLTPVESLDRYINTINELTADGATAIGDAILEAANQLPDTTGQHRAVMLMTDGENNVGEEPAPAIEFLEDEGIELYLVPTSADVDEELAALATASRSRRNAVFSASSGAELPAAFFESFARSRSEGLVMSRTLSAVALRPPVVKQIELPPGTPPPDQTIGDENLPTSETFSIPVESLAGRLNVIVSSLNPSGEIWSPRIRLYDPNGDEVLNDQSPGVAVGQLVRLFQIAPQEQGTYELEISALGQVPQRSMLLAHIQSPHPDCRASLSRTTALPGDIVRVQAHAFWDNEWISHGVNFVAKITSTDGTVSTVPLQTSIDPLVGATGEFSVDANTGIHNVVVTCDVTESAVFGPGEKLPNSEPPPTTAHNPSPPGRPAPEFRREALASVLVRDPANCLQSPASVACCSDLSACSTTQDVAILTGLGLDGVGTGGGGGGFSGLLLSDRSSMSSEDGTPIEVLSAGSATTELGADSIIGGSLFSLSNVFARERASMSGALVTAGTLSQQNGVNIQGGVTQGATLTFPAGSLTVPAFPETNRGDRHLEPDTTGALTPGAYGHITVKSRATLKLIAGNYWFESLSIEPQGIVQTAGGLPTRLFVEGNVSLKEAVAHQNDRHDLILLFTLTQNEIFIEKPLSGTIVAPRTSVVLSGTSGTVHRGAVFARGVHLRADVKLEHHGFPWSWIPGAVPSVQAQYEAASGSGASARSPHATSVGSCGIDQRGGSTQWWLLLVPILALHRKRRRRDVS